MSFSLISSQITLQENDANKFTSLYLCMYVQLSMTFHTELFAYKTSILENAITKLHLMQTLLIFKSNSLMNFPVTLSKKLRWTWEIIVGDFFILKRSEKAADELFLDSYLSLCK